MGIQITFSWDKPRKMSKNSVILPENFPIVQLSRKLSYACIKQSQKAAIYQPILGDHQTTEMITRQRYIQVKTTPCKQNKSKQQTVKERRILYLNRTFSKVTFSFFFFFFRPFRPIFSFTVANGPTINLLNSQQAYKILRYLANGPTVNTIFGQRAYSKNSISATRPTIKKRRYKSAVSLSTASFQANQS